MRSTLAILLLSTLFFVSCGKPNPEARLNRAAFLGNVDEMKTLIDGGMDVNKVVDGSAPIHQAVRGGHVEAMTLLVEKGADTKTKDGQGRTAWDLVYSGNSSFFSGKDCRAMAFLLQNGYEGSLTLVEAASKGDSAFLIETLIDDGADPNAVDEYGWTPLHHAAYHGRSESCLSLLQAGSDPNAESTKEFSKTSGAGEHENTLFRYEVGSRPLDVARHSVRDQHPVRPVLEEWGASENPNVKNVKR